MDELLTAAQMRSIEAAAIDSGAVSGLELMERAGRGVVEAVFETWPELAQSDRRAAILCGPGNNGGDGLVVARLLAEWGWTVEVFLFGDPARLPPDARANYQRWSAMGGVHPATARPERPCDLYVDALFGTGLGRLVTDPALGDWLGLIERISASRDGARTVAVDMPSGLCADSGRVLVDPTRDGPGAARVGLTVSFHRAKLGHVLAEGPGLCGRLVTKDIGLDGRAGAGAARGDAAVLVGAPDAARLDKTGRGHKYDHGHALIIAGGPGRGGAARLAARAALRIGAGLVTVGAPPDALAENAAQLNAIMLRPVADADELVAVTGDTRLNALCLGPGLGRDRAGRRLVRAALGARRAIVLDADALSGFADDPEALFSMLHEKAVLTPHAGEFARLFPDIADRLNAPAERGPAYSRLDATREAAARAGCVVLFKGPDTVISAPDGRSSVNSAAYERSCPWLATAGAGDVLAGLVAGLLARGLAPMQAAEAAAWLHVECAREFGPGLIAEDLPETLPAVLRRLTR